ncbi:hypothetical protein PHSY_004027 [Pseudozyma hubeiensis SY62]|uniref:Uncharacterized protein n=1 Tax=Pseudozyma hubeiensis (strain SY62) TaxID=1305764 RepID=R9P5E5_PSEHS|nr:hypothetical protein PHSY_004027 [Pseudozyma hubeiensis SY62]GAC96447.1 hypothetical protein PHSY_004027 [Pseudozyma hubeiensis SY62]
MRLSLASSALLPSSGLPCTSSFAWTSALIGGVTIRAEDLAASMVLFFILLVFLVIGLLRTYQGRHLLDILFVFTPTLLFVICLTIWSALRAHLSNTLHRSNFDPVLSQQILSEMVAANGLISCSPMLLGETTFHVFGLLAKRIATRGKSTIGLWLRYRLSAGVVFHIITILSCLMFHFAWKCVRDWAAVQVYLSGDWSKSTFGNDADLEELARRIRREAERPVLFYLLGIVPIVTAMILIYTLDLVSYTNPPPPPAAARDPHTTRFHLFLDPKSPRIELLLTSKNATAAAGKGGEDGKKGGGGGGGREGKGDASKATGGEMYVVKRGWLGGWSLQPAKKGDSWMTKIKKRAQQGVQSWIMGWSSKAKGATAV